MSPEQLGGKDYGENVDLWSVGAILYEMVTGRKVFDVTTQKELVIMGNTGPGARNYALLTVSGKVWVILDDNTTYKNVISTTTINTGDWFHVMGVRDGNNLRLYINGVEDTAATDITGYGDLDLAGTSFVVGSAATGQYHNDALAEILIYTKALTPSEVDQIYNYSLETYS